MSDANIEGSAPSASPTPAEPHHLRRVFIIWIVVSVIGIVIWLLVSPFIVPQTASDLGSSQILTFNMLTVLAVPVAMFVFVFLAYSLIFFRVKDRPEEDGPSFTAQASTPNWVVGHHWCSLSVFIHLGGFFLLSGDHGSLVQ